MKRFIIIFLTFFALLSATYGETIHVSIKKRNFVDTIVSEDLYPWLVPIFTPVVAIHRDQQPILMSTDDREQVDQIFKIMKAQKCLYAGNTITYFETELNVKKFHVTSPMETSINIARMFWKKTDKVVLVSMQNPQIVIQSSIFAAVHKIPIILVEEEVDDTDYSIALHEKFVTSFLKDLEVKKVIILGTVPQWLRKIHDVENFHSRKVQQAIIEKFNSKKITNVITSRIPSNSHFPRSEWIIPYLSFVRKAPVFFSHSPQPARLEKAFQEFIAQYHLSPQNITIVADEQNIHTKTLHIPSDDGEIYEFEVEPFTLAEEFALNYGLGRIPFTTLEEASLMVAKGFVHERILQEQKPKVLMTANSTAELVLAETISKITSEEFKNLDIDIDEFYSGNYDDEKIWESLKTANLVIFEGHVTDQRVFVDPDAEQEEMRFYFEESEDFGEDAYLPEERQPENRPSENAQSESESEENYFVEDAFPVPSEPQKANGLPFVMLQSCNSLDMDTAGYIFRCGSIGIIGTTTNVHSGSGSSILKVMCDEIIYNNKNVGEALREARNYFLCLNKLKSLRGHTQMAKGKRVALSFRLWGDPELKIFPKKITTKKRRLVRFKLEEDEKKVYIYTPKNKLPLCISDLYYSDMFHNTKVAGIVKTVENKEQRLIMPLLFAKLKISPNWLDKHGFDNIYRVKDKKKKTRAVFIPTQDKKYVYVLYFPEKLEKDKTIKLHFIKGMPKNS